MGKFNMSDRTAWFGEAKYGLFIHWGLYSILGGVWKGQRAYHTSEWIMRNMRIPLEEYKKLKNEFCPVQFDAREYVRMAKRWGMKYICITAKHHDGFALFDTGVSDYSITNTPYGKDIVKQLADACAEEGVTFCVYYSQMQDWEDPNADGNDWDFRKEDKDFKKYFYGKCIPQVKELLTNYGRIGMIWFDTPYEMPKELCEELRDTVKACQPDCLINGRIGYGLGDYRNMADNLIPHNAYHGLWESPMTLNGTWGCSRFDNEWVSPTEVIRRLSLIVGKGGNLLLNIGPEADGTIPQRSVEILDAVGEWLSSNGDSIYGIDLVPEFPYDHKSATFTYSKERSELYMHVLNYPKLTPRVSIIGIRTRVESARLLATGEEFKFTQTYEHARDEERFAVWVPEECPDKIDTVIAIKLKGDLVTQRLDEGFYAVK